MFPLTFNTYVRDAFEMIDNEEAYPFLDFDGTRYLIDTSQRVLGMLVVIPFNITTQESLGIYYQSMYGMQTTFREAILGPGPRSAIALTREVEFPGGPDDNAQSGVVAY